MNRPGLATMPSVASMREWFARFFEVLKEVFFQMCRKDYPALSRVDFDAIWSRLLDSIFQGYTRRATNKLRLHVRACNN